MLMCKYIQNYSEFYFLICLSSRYLYDLQVFFTFCHTCPKQLTYFMKEWLCLFFISIGTYLIFIILIFVHLDKVVTLEVVVKIETMVSNVELDGSVELLIGELLKLDGIEAEEEAKLRRKTKVRIIYRHVASFDI